MAIHILSPATGPTGADNPPAFDGRVQLALEAAWELENIADIVIGMCPALQPEQMAIRGLSIRVGDLSRVIMSALGDELDPVEEIRARFTGERRPAADQSGVTHD